jgi:Uma2 family endonuclease
MIAHSPSVPFPKLSPEEYFQWEERQREKHEYLDGQIYAMGSGSKNHSVISVRLSTLFCNHLDGGDCEIGNSDLKIQIVNTQNYTYPDVSVTCDPRDRESTQFITYPCLVVEVLSPSTEAYDRGGKFRLYARNPMLQDYLLVSSTSVEIDLYHKNDDGDWLILNYQASDRLELKSIGLSFAVDVIYRGLAF